MSVKECYECLREYMTIYECLYPHGYKTIGFAISFMYIFVTTTQL